MAKRCDICEKGKLSGHHVSHAINRNKRTFKPNIQKVRVKFDGGQVKKMNVCTRCLRSGRVQKAL